MVPVKMQWFRDSAMSRSCWREKLLTVTGTLLLTMPGLVTAEIIWKGDFENGTFLQWHQIGDTATPFYAGIPNYGRPPAPNPLTGSKPEHYYGDGSLVQLVTSPVREGKYAARLVVKNSKNGSEPADCDSGEKVCRRRRTELQMHRAMSDHYNGMPYMSERWVSASYFVPKDWDSVNGSGYLNVLQLKPRNDGQQIGSGMCIRLLNDGWHLRHAWDDKVNPIGDDVPNAQEMDYSASSPSSSNWPDGLVDYPDAAASRAALASVNKDGWTDWVLKIKFDARGSQDGGTGYMQVWKREDNGPWIHVLSVKPKVTTRQGLTFDHGIMFNVPPTDSNNGGFDVQAGMYMSLSQVWDLPNNRVIYIDNIKVGDNRSVFADMSPDGSSPGSDALRPMAPYDVNAR